MAERYEVFTLGKHFLQIHTEKGFTLYANAKLVNGQLTSYTDKMTRRGGSWTINVWKFLNKKDFPINPIYTAVFGFDSEDTAVSVNGTDIDSESISGVNGQLVDVGNISLDRNVSLPVNEFAGADVKTYIRFNEESPYEQGVYYKKFSVNLNDFKFFKLTGKFFYESYNSSYSPAYLRYWVDFDNNKIYGGRGSTLSSGLITGGDVQEILQFQLTGVFNWVGKKGDTLIINNTLERCILLDDVDFGSFVGYAYKKTSESAENIVYKFVF